MPTRLLVASLVLALTAACQSKLPQPQPVGCIFISSPAPGPTDAPGQAGLVGRWQLVRSVGGLTGRLVVYPSKLVIDMFTADSTYQHCLNGQCAAPVGFTVRTERSFLTGQPAPLLRRGGMTTCRLVAANDSLVISQEAADGFTDYYVRLPR